MPSCLTTPDLLCLGCVSQDPSTPTPPHLQIWLCRKRRWLGLLLGGRDLRGCRTRSTRAAAPLTKAHSSRGLGSGTPGAAGNPGCMTESLRCFWEPKGQPDGGGRAQGEWREGIRGHLLGLGWEGAAGWGVWPDWSPDEDQSTEGGLIYEGGGSQRLFVPLHTHTQSPN